MTSQGTRCSHIVELKCLTGTRGNERDACQKKTLTDVDTFPLMFCETYLERRGGVLPRQRSSISASAPRLQRHAAIPQMVVVSLVHKSLMT
ncbi:hypothetical protein EYF80_020999 [Liparis tanakae]|uniref:Uncharacterized protein n=1 Tax=Liparis tanakae TaxID=230148 RepID=A0A4Z2HTD7_9TELE|nr:hypothetical protein EYF80_020999 [Liparis tanakae]